MTGQAELPAALVVQRAFQLGKRGGEGWRRVCKNGAAHAAGIKNSFTELTQMKGSERGLTAANEIFVVAAVSSRFRFVMSLLLKNPARLLLFFLLSRTHAPAGFLALQPHGKRKGGCSIA